MMMVQLRNPQCSYFLQHANKMRQSGTLCDVVIVVGRQTFQAHRLVLAIASKRLEGHFASRGGSQRQHCTLDTLSSHTFRHVLDYAYAETLEVSVEDLHGLQRAAQLLEMHQLGEQCRLQLETLNLQVTDSHKKDSLIEKVESSETSKSSPLLEDQLDTEVQEYSPSSSPHYKKPRPDDTLVVAMPSRVSVIASTTARQPNPLPSSSPRLGWNQITSSPRMAVSSTDFLAIQSLHPSEHLVACPLPFSAPMYPLFSPTPLPQFHHDSIMGYTGIIHPFHHALPPGPQALGIPVKHSLPGKNASTGAAQMNRVPEDKERKPQRRTDKTFQCRPQVKDFLDSQQLQMHDDGDSEQSEVSLGCKYCGRCFGDESSLRSHRRVHNGEKPYQCKRCPKRFSLKHQLDTHYRVHTGEKPFECRLCGQRSRDYSAMIKHLRTHGGAAPYQCTVCLEFCSSQAAMQKHIKDHPAQDFPADWSIHSTYLYNCHS